MLVGRLLEAERLFAAASSLAPHPRDLLRWAVLAPSRSNTQPWRFDVAGDEIRVYGDAARALPIADPDGRELVLACGAAIANLRLAAAHHGHATSLEVVDGVHDDGLLARVRLEERRAPTGEEEALFAAIPRRRTNRLPLDGREPPEGLVAALARAARLHGAVLEPVEPHQRVEVAELVVEGDRRQWADPRFRAELSAWTRTNGSPRRDGLFGWSQGLGDAASLLAPLRVRLTRGEDEAARDRRRALGTKALVVLSAPGDDPAAWLAAGAALQQVLLHATAAGLSASYFSQPFAFPDLRRRLAAAAGTAGKPLALFRLGYGLDLRAAPRRPVEEVLREESPPRAIRSLAQWRPPVHQA